MIPTNEYSRNDDQKYVYDRRLIAGGGGGGDLGHLTFFHVFTITAATAAGECLNLVRSFEYIILETKDF